MSWGRYSMFLGLMLEENMGSSIESIIKLMALHPSTRLSFISDTLLFYLLYTILHCAGLIPQMLGFRGQ